ncbi:MAG: hypothetical protein U5N58_04390 [Actinomycetota bacterium]|nr:hypothetical protein [Actinomycetota bacterium]
MVKGHGCGLVFNPEDIRGMSEAAINILSDQKLKDKMALAARNRAKDFDCNKNCS